MYVFKGIIFLFLFFSFFTGCSEVQTRGAVPVHLNLIFPAGQVVPSQGLSKGSPSNTKAIPATLTLQVTGPGMETIFLLRDIPQNGEVIININIPAGPARRFSMTAFDAGGKPIFQGESALINLNPGDLSVVVTIPFVSIEPLIQPIVDPPTVTLSVGLNTMNEASGTTTVTAVLSATSSLLVTVTLTKGGTASETADYILDDAILIPAGALSASVTLTVVNDLLDENDELVIIDIDTVTNGTELGTQQQTILIIDDNDPPTVTLSVGSESINEKNPATSTLVTATLSAASTKVVTVTLSTTGTATTTLDYTLPLIITIPAGISSGSVTLAAVNDDPLDENDETVIIDMACDTNSNCTENGTQTQTVTIVDETNLPTVTLSVGSASLTEGNATETATSTAVTATLSAVSANVVTVTLDKSGTAQTTRRLRRSALV